MKRKLHTALGVLLICSVVALFGCSKGSDSEEKSAYDLCEQGWSAYTARDYGTAAQRFGEAVIADPGYAESYNGLGWSNAKLDNLVQAQAHFTEGLSRLATSMDMRAGIAFVYNAQKNYSSSNQRAMELLGASPNWTFLRDRSISSTDIHLLIAENYFALSDYEASFQRVRLLNASFTADVSTVAGQKALAQEIERLRSVV